MWVTVYLCGAMFGRLDCIKIQDPGPGVNATVCALQLPYAWKLTYRFKLQNPTFWDYKFTYKECSGEKVGRPSRDT
jgi:hypothetical protein